MVAQLIADLLSDAGFIVTQITNPRHALRLAEAEAFDVVLSDFKMPDMDGEAFYRAMRALSPRMADRVGFITGDAMSAKVHNFLLSSGRPYIEKPVIKAELISLVDQVHTGPEAAE